MISCISDSTEILSHVYQLYRQSPWRPTKPIELLDDSVRACYIDALSIFRRIRSATEPQRWRFGPWAWGVIQYVARSHQVRVERIRRAVLNAKHGSRA